MDEIFQTRKPVIGMLHLPALPGSPTNELSISAIRDHTLKDAEALAGGGVNGVIIELRRCAVLSPRSTAPYGGIHDGDCPGRASGG